MLIQQTHLFDESPSTVWCGPAHPGGECRSFAPPPRRPSLGQAHSGNVADLLLRFGR